MKKSIFIFLLCIAAVCVNAQTMNVDYKTVNNSNTTAHYSVSATYPQIDFGPDALMGVRGIASDINNVMDTTVNGIIRDFEKQVAEMPSEAVNGNTSSLEITSRGWISNSSLFSAELTTFNNVAGMAHPMTTVTTFNFSDNGGGPYALSDLFLTDSQYLNYISTVCIKQLMDHAQKEGYDNIKDMILSGASADAKNFNEWTIKNDSLNIIFNPYQAGPYVMGIQTVSIPLSDLTSMVNPNGPIGFMKR